MPQTSAYASLIQRLDAFIRKYYLNQVIRGTLYTLAVVGLAFLAVSLLEANLYLDRVGRKTLFYGFIAVSALALVGWVIVPLARYFRLGSVISHDQAATIIGSHFTNVQDKLLNLLQLGRRAELEQATAPEASNYDLLLAGINQKSTELQPVPFRTAIDLGQNRRYLRYALPPLLLLLVLLVAAPTLITDSTNRLVRNNEDFERPAPFAFVLPQGDLSVVQFEDFPLTVEARGEIVPAEAYVEIDGNPYQMKPEGSGRFSYNFASVAADVPFRVRSGEIASKSLTLDVIEKPNLLGFQVAVDYPGYTTRRDEVLDNLGDLTVPEGTKLRWTFEADHTESIEMRFGASLDTMTREGRELFQHEHRARRSTPYTVISGNAALPRADSVRYGLTVVPDRYPSISAETFRDSTQRNVLFFAGEAADDYGLSALRFVYIRKGPDGEEVPVEPISLAKPGGKVATFEHTFDIGSLSLKPGEEISYYFETLDNDGVNGAKSAKTPVESFKKKTLEEYSEARAEQTDDIKKKLKKSVEESREIQEEIKRLREKLLQERDVDWQAKQELDKLLKRQSELNEQIEQSKQKFEEQREEQAEFSEPDEELAERQEKLEEMFDQLQDPELQAIMEQIQELMEKLEKEQALDMMQEMEEGNDEQEQKLDRMLELFKQLDVEYDVQEAAKQLDSLAERQEELAEQTEQKDDQSANEEEQAAQEKLNEEFEKLTEKTEEIEQKNAELERPKETGTDKEAEEQVKQDQQEAGEEMKAGENKKAGGKQKQAAEKMKEMAQQMRESQESGEMEQMQEDMASMRQLLENLVSISFDQEDLMGTLAEVEVNTPRYVEEVQRQFKLEDDFQIVEDSLQALAKRVIQIESFVLDKVTDIKSQLGKSLGDLEERQVAEAGNRQQRVMTDVNDLALMLSESMQQMQQQMAAAMPGNQSCEKPGGKGQGKPGQEGPKDKMSQGQQSLKEQMERAMENMKKQAEGGKAGKRGQGGQPSSKEFAEMAAQQAALRKELRDKQRELQEMGQGSQELEETIDGMNKTEEDLVNKRLTNEMLKRQEDILTRLLEAEKAERQQDEDERRKSESAEQIERSLPPALEEYLKQRANQTDLYREVSPELRPYYRQLVERYFEELKAR